MISAELPSGRTPRVVAVYSFRYDAHLVPDLLENLAPLVDGWIGFDDRQADGLFSPEVARRNALLEAARDSGAEWVICLDPDERLDRRLAALMPELTATPGRKYSLWYRNLYEPNAYRVDGAWGKRRRVALFSLSEGLVDPGPERLHLPWDAHFGKLREQRLDLAMYHLKMLAPERRVARAALYEHIDPEHRMQRLGYEYLTDERWLRLERILPGEGFDPPHREDGGLWAGNIPAEALERSRNAAAQRDADGIRVLVLTDQVETPDAASTLAVETAQWFVDRGDSVTVAAHRFGEPLRLRLDGVEQTTQFAGLIMEDFDLVWTQQGTLDSLTAQIGAAARRGRLPLFLVVDRAPDPVIARALSARIPSDTAPDAALPRARDRARSGTRRRGLRLWIAFRLPSFRRRIAAALARGGGQGGRRGG